MYGLIGCRLYYAVFYAAKAALLSVREEPKSHSGTVHQVYQVLYQEQELVERDTAIIIQTL